MAEALGWLLVTLSDGKGAEGLEVEEEGCAQALRAHVDKARQRIQKFIDRS